MVLSNWLLHDTIYGDKYIIYGHQATTDIALDDNRHPTLYNICSMLIIDAYRRCELGAMFFASTMSIDDLDYPQGATFIVFSP